MTFYRRDPQQYLYFLPLPQGQGSLRPTLVGGGAGRGVPGGSSSAVSSAEGGGEDGGWEPITGCGFCGSGEGAGG